MINFNVKTRSRGNDNLFTAKIDCKKEDPLSLKLRLSVIWALENKVSLVDADLRDADLSNMYLAGEDLCGALLDRTDLSNAYLDGIDFSATSMCDVNLQNTEMYGASLSSANLSGANLSGVDLQKSDLNFTKLSNTNLNGTKLSGAHGMNEYVKIIHINKYSITYTSNVIYIGSYVNLISEWKDFDDDKILSIGDEALLSFWCKYKKFIFQGIKLAPAKDTGIPIN
jgi:hypothetical protein